MLTLHLFGLLKHGQRRFASRVCSRRKWFCDNTGQRCLWLLLLRLPAAIIIDSFFVAVYRCCSLGRSCPSSQNHRVVEYTAVSSSLPRTQKIRKHIHGVYSSIILILVIVALRNHVLYNREDRAERQARSRKSPRARVEQ